MANNQEVKKDLQSSSKPTLEQLVNKANENKQVSKEELEIILERYKLEQKSINAKTKTDIDILSKEAGMDIIQKGISLKTKKDIQLLLEILSKNGIETKIDEKTKTKIFDTKGVVAIYDNNDKQILLYGNTGTRLGNINKEGGFDEINFSLFRKNNDPKDDDLGLIKDKNAIKESVKKEDIPSSTEQEIKDAQFGLNVLDKYTKIELNEIYKKSGIDGLKKLAKLHGMMSQNDIRLGLQEFGYSYDKSHVIAAVKILKVFGEETTKIEDYLNGGVVKTNEKQTSFKSEWLNPDDIEKHRNKFLEVLKNTKDINELLKKENKVSYDYVFKNLNHKNTAGKLIFEEEGKLFGEKLKSYTCAKYKLDANKLNILIDPSQNPNIKVKLVGKDYGQIVIKDNKFELRKIRAISDSKKAEKSESNNYKVKKGDSLWKITKGNQKLMKRIKELNPDVKDWNKLSIGQNIKLPIKGESTKIKENVKSNGKKINSKEKSKNIEGNGDKTNDKKNTKEIPKENSKNTGKKTEQETEIINKKSEIEQVEKVQYEKGQKFINEKKYEDAFSIFKKLVEQNSNNHEYVLKLGYIYEKLGKPDIAKECYTKSEEIKNKTRDKKVITQKKEHWWPKNFPIPPFTN